MPSRPRINSGPKEPGRPVAGGSPQGGATEGRLQRESIAFILTSPCHRGSDQTPLLSPPAVTAAMAACQILQSEVRKGSDHVPPTLVCHCSRKAPPSVSVSILRETTASDSRLRKIAKHQTPLLVASELLSPPPPHTHSRQPNTGRFDFLLGIWGKSCFGGNCGSPTVATGILWVSTRKALSSCLSYRISGQQRV